MKGIPDSGSGRDAPPHRLDAPARRRSRTRAVRLRRAPSVEGLEDRQLLAAPAPITNLPALPVGVAIGPMTTAADGSLWAANAGGPAGFYHVSPTGSVTNVPLPAADAFGTITAVTAGPGDTIWFSFVSANQSTGKVGRVAPNGAVTEFALPTPGELPGAITLGPDGAMWFAETGLAGTRVGRVSTGGSVTDMPVAVGSLGDLTSGPGGDLWFVDGTKIGKMTLTGAVTEYAIPPAVSGKAFIAWAAQLTPSPDGTLWFLSPQGIDRVTATGTFRHYPTPALKPTALTVGSSGNVWFAGQDVTKGTNGQSTVSNVVALGRLTPDGLITPVRDPAALDGAPVVLAMAPTPGGTIWLDGGGLSLSLLNTSAVRVPATISVSSVTSLSTNTTTSSPSTTTAAEVLAPTPTPTVTVGAPTITGRAGLFPRGRR